LKSPLADNNTIITHAYLGSRGDGDGLFHYLFY